MLGALPALFLAATLAALGAVRHRFHGGRLGWRDALGLSLLAAGAWGAAGGELLTLGANLTFWPVLAWWLVPTLALGAFAFVRRDSLRGWPPPVARPDGITCLFIGCSAALLVATGLIALLTPPNNFDSQMYHMPRQVFWMQQGSLAHYPSHDLRQLEFPPMAESLGVQQMILSGGDWWAGMVQWAAFAGCVLFASAIARDLGAPARGQALAALLVATIPAAIHQAVNPKNDLVVALWVCLLAYFAVRIRLEGACGAVRAICIGLALGLLLYTKGTAYLFALPIAMLLGLWMLTSLRLRAIPAVLVIGLVAAGLNAGHWSRNYESFGHPLGLSAAGRGYHLTNEITGPSALVSGVVRNVSLHTATPSARINGVQERAVARLHEGLGLDPSDPRTTTPDGYRFDIHWALREDGHAGAPVHALLAGASPLLMLGASRTRKNTMAWCVLATGLASFLVFCAVLKWQPWHARLHIPILVLFAPVSGLLLSVAPGGPLKGLLVLAAFAVGAGALALNNSKPLVGERSVLRSSRDEMLFRGDRGALDAARAAVGAAAEFRPRVISIAWSRSGFEYSMLHLALRDANPAARVVSVGAHRGPPRPAEAPEPDVIIGWNPRGAAMIFSQMGKGYAAVAQPLPWTVYARDALVREARHDPDEPFVGWKAVEGLAPPSGPFPQWNLPVVRWGLGPRTRLEFESSGDAAELVLECRRAESPDQAIEVLLNGEPVYRFEFSTGRGFIGHRIPLRPRTGLNEIEIRCATSDLTPSGQQRAVLYRRIQINPRPAGAPAP